MGEQRFRVRCNGAIDDGARQRINLEISPESWTGGALPPGQPFPSVAETFDFNVVAASPEEAISRIREIVEGAGGRVDGFEAEPLDQP